MADLTLDDLRRSERLRAVTDNFFFWQGLRFAPVGLAIMILAFVTARADLNQRLSDGIMIATVFVAATAMHFIGKAYRRDYGTVRPNPNAHLKRSRLKWLLVYPVMFASLTADLLVDTLPIMLSGFVWGCSLILYRNSTGGGRTHYFVLAAALAALSLAPLATAVSIKEAVTIMLLVLGAGYTAAALLDDRELRQVLPGASGA